jgi:hypothetical protein
MRKVLNILVVFTSGKTSGKSFLDSSSNSVYVGRETIVFKELTSRQVPVSYLKLSSITLWYVHMLLAGTYIICIGELFIAGRK